MRRFRGAAFASLTMATCITDLGQNVAADSGGHVLYFGV
jgi:hypothetical protein